MDRRAFLASLALIGASGVAAAEPLARPPPGEEFEGLESLLLWPGAPPGATAKSPSLVVTDISSDPARFHNRALTGISEPRLFVFRAARSDGSALMLIPGGGYSEIWVDGEGFSVARYFSAQGVTAFVLVYRLPGEGWLQAPDVPLQDAQRAMRLIRGGAAGFGVDPDRIGAMGFSAGGHIAASLATRFDARVYEPGDASDGLTARPAFAAMLYPVITMLPPFAHEASRMMLLGTTPSTALRAAYSCERLIGPDTPPCFLGHALDDPDVPPENTLMFGAALRSAKVPSEMHLFERGGHGFALGTPGAPDSMWPDLLAAWARGRGFLSA